MMFSHKREDLSVSVPQAAMDPCEEKTSVLAEARERFDRSPYRELHEVICDFHEGVLTLRGRVPSEFLRQIAQSTVFSMDRIETINNRLEIGQP